MLVEVKSREQRKASDEEHAVFLSVEIEINFPGIPAPIVSNYSLEFEFVNATFSGISAMTVLVG